MFCLIGGVSFVNVESYLLLLNVVCVGGSWVVLNDMVKFGDWVGIEVFVKEVS